MSLRFYAAGAVLTVLTQNNNPEPLVRTLHREKELGFIITPACGSKNLLLEGLSGSDMSYPLLQVQAYLIIMGSSDCVWGLDPIKSMCKV